MFHLSTSLRRQLVPVATTLFAVVLSATAVSPPALAARNATRPTVSTELSERAVRDGEVRVLVGLAVDTRTEATLSKAGAAKQRARIAAAQDRVLADLANTDHRLGRRYSVIPYLALTVSPEALDRLAASGQVRGIYPDRWRKADLLDSVPLVGANNLHAQGIGGQGTAVAILDSGTDTTHPFFGGRVVSEACFSVNGSCPNGGTTMAGPGAARPCLRQIDGCDHGTHVAGIAAGNQGVAPAAKIVAINVFSNTSGEDCGDEGGECIRTADSDYIAGLERVLALRSQFNIVSANMSLGGGQSFGNCDVESAPVKAIVDQLLAANVATVISSGNSGFHDSLGDPGCVSSAVTVGSTTKSDELSDFSNSHPVVDILAPGSQIQSATVGGDYVFYSGTSMAAPHVAGAWALLRQVQPNASVGQVLQALQGTGPGITDFVNGLTRPRIQIDAAAQALAGGGGGGNNTTLSLVNGRFRVAVRWFNQFDGTQGDGRALPQTNLSGYFAFNDPNNIELIVKILDFGSSIKVFYSQLTSLQFTMTVTDTFTGRTKQYGPTAGNCGAIDQNYASFTGGLELSASGDEIASASSLAAAGKAACSADPTRLCLLNSRFQIRMEWRSQFTGAGGLGGAVPLSNLTGQFFFTESSNIEVLTKVLDFNGRILFFFGALSDLEFLIEVVDTFTGQTKYFYNPPGNYCGGSDPNF